jgi:hypothetical protein
MRTPALSNVMLVAALMTASCVSEARPPAADGSTSEPAAVGRTNASPRDDHGSGGLVVWRYGGIAAVAIGR